MRTDMSMHQLFWFFGLWSEIDEWNFEVDGMLSDLAEQSKILERSHMRTSRSNWNVWVEEALEGGAKMAHRFSKLPVAWQPTYVTSKSGASSSDPMQLLDGEREKFLRNTLQWHRMVSGASAHNGIVAGCSMATTAVKVYCLVPFDAVIQSNPHVDFDHV